MGGNQRQASSRLGGLKGAAASGDIVEVHGGRIVRSTGRKDRHSKVCTAKGPRDRRVRLAADTAIQFYDVQDRLGYDRPSKAVDWLMKKAKSAIDALAQLPAWDPRESHHPDIQQSQQQALDRSPIPPGAGSRVEDCGDFGRLMENGNDDGSGFLTPSLDSDSIADTIKSLFPKDGSGSGTTTTTSCLQFQSYPPSPDLISRSTSINQSQDLSLSLQSLADPNLLHHHQSHHRNQNTLFSGFDAPGTGWNSGGSADTVGCGSGGGGAEFSSALPPLPVLFGQSGQLFCQRGPLQSSYTPSIRAWFDPSEHQYYQFPPAAATTINNQSLISGIGLGSSTYSGFQIPARIRGEEDHDGGAAPSKPSSVSSDSRH